MKFKNIFRKIYKENKNKNYFKCLFTSICQILIKYLFYTLIKFILHHLIKITQRIKIELIIIKFWNRSFIFWTSLYAGWW